MNEWHECVYMLFIVDVFVCRSRHHHFGIKLNEMFSIKISKWKIFIPDSDGYVFETKQKEFSELLTRISLKKQNRKKRNNFVCRTWENKLGKLFFPSIFQFNFIACSIDLSIVIFFFLFKIIEIWFKQTKPNILNSWMKIVHWNCSALFDVFFLLVYHSNTSLCLFDIRYGHSFFFRLFFSVFVNACVCVCGRDAKTTHYFRRNESKSKKKKSNFDNFPFLSLFRFLSF